MLLLCGPDWVNIEVAKTSLMMGLYNSFQSDRHLAPSVIHFIVFFHHAYEFIGRTSPSVLQRSEAAVFSLFSFMEARYGQHGKVSGSVMRNVSKAKFDGSLLESSLLERAEWMTTVWLSMRT